MTIHTKWMELLRNEASDAFEYGQTPTSPVEGGFIDGQIKLMISPDPNQTWADFIFNKFTSVVMRHFASFGCSTVVLAFDDRRHVPKAKAITQSKRRAGVNIIEFDETNELPNHMPVEWKESIMNPHFKHRVIELICANVPRLVPISRDVTLIIDWEQITEYKYSNGEVTVTHHEEPDPVGEADLKFARWMRRLQCPMLVEATDGDYIPISLGLKHAGCDSPITLLKAWKPDKGGFEFISMPLLHAFLLRSCRGAQGGIEITLFIVLLGLSGTDFTRNLPLLSPQKMWSALPYLLRTIQVEDGLLAMGPGKRLVELLYAEAFPKHIDALCRSSIWSQAQASKLGQRNKALIPTDARIMCTLRNVNFLLVYWLDFRPPARIEDFGFRIGDKGAVEWDD